MKYTNKLKPATRADSAQMLRMLNGSGVVQRTTTQRDIIRINFTAQGIGTADEHLEELEAIRSSGPEDLIVVYFTDCGGGVVGTGMSLINAVMETHAHTVAVLEGHNASMCSMIPLVFKEIIVTPYASMMLHSAAGSNYGTIANLERQSTFFSKMFSDFMEDIYDGFVDPLELEDLRKGLEIYLSADEIEERLSKRAELMQAEAEINGDCGCDGCEEHLAEAVATQAVKPVPAKKKAPVKKASPKNTK